MRWQPLRRWALPVAAGAAAFPAIDWVHKSLAGLLAAAGGTAVAAGGAAGGGGGGGQGTLGHVLAAQDWCAQGMWFAMLAVCAPIWEEAMFRGFLVPSLAKYMPQARRRRRCLSDCCRRLQ